MAQVSSLAQLIAGVAAEHGGRVFNTAGDGFLLEFQTVTGALEAADAIRSRANLPVRLGMHLGEVSVAGVDLLGHGVNVAARLQAKAPVGAILVSGDAMRAVRSDLSRRFSPAGRIRLHKMRETLAVYIFEPAGKARTSRPRLSGKVLWASLAVLAVALGAAGLLGLHAGTGPLAWIAAPQTAPGGPQPGAKVRVAVSRLDILGDADTDLRRFTGGPPGAHGPPVQRKPDRRDRS
ncbi:MAG: adenylate/guanylate cyclase domain-containing protein [Caulobacteraceae bacterium]